MGNQISGLRVFLGQFFRQYHFTGSILPSGRALGAALSQFVRNGRGPRRILEVGPGTGAVTARIVKDLGDDDELHLVELNDKFVQHLKRRFETEPRFQRVAARSRIIHSRLEDLPPGERYDVIISCLPLNNFAAAEVRSILDLFRQMLEPGGSLSFFQYIAIRRVKSLVAGREGRERLRGIGEALNGVLGQRQIRRQAVWLNFPPAWVHHVRFDPAPEAVPAEAHARAAAAAV